MSARLQAIDQHLRELEVEVEKLVTAISNECHIKGILSNEVYQSLRKSTKSRRGKTKDLISRVWDSIREDDKKCEIFIQILAKHKSCRDLVSRIRRDQEDIANRAKVNQAKDTSRSSMLLPTQKSPKQQRSARPTQCTESSKKGKKGESIKLGRTGGMCLASGTEGHYNAKMELQQEEAKLNEEQEKVKKLEAERDAMKRKRSNLENKFQLKDKELDRLVTERDNLKYSNDILRLKITRVEKNRYADKQTVEKRITEDENKITKLEMEKEELKAALKACDEEYRELQQTMAMHDDKAKSYQATIDKLKSELAEHKSELAEHCQERNKTHDCGFCHCQNFVVKHRLLVTAFLLCLMIIIYM